MRKYSLAPKLYKKTYSETESEASLSSKVFSYHCGENILIFNDA